MSYSHNGNGPAQPPNGNNRPTPTSAVPACSFLPNFSVPPPPYNGQSAAYTSNQYQPSAPQKSYQSYSDAPQTHSASRQFYTNRTARPPGNGMNKNRNRSYPFAGRPEQPNSGFNNSARAGSRTPSTYSGRSSKHDQEREPRDHDRQRNRERYRERDRDRERDGDRARNREGDRTRERESERPRERDGDRVREREGERPREREGERPREREGERPREREGERPREREDERPREREGERPREREGERAREREGTRDRERSRDRERDRDCENEHETDKDEPTTERDRILSKWRSNYCEKAEDITRKLAELDNDEEKECWIRSSPADLYYRRTSGSEVEASARLEGLCTLFNNELVDRAERARQAQPKIEVPPRRRRQRVCRHKCE